MSSHKAESIVGCLLGTAVGDAIALPYEGLSKQVQRRGYPQIKGHNFFLNTGMVSDDTEHTCMVAQSLIVSAGNVEIFAKELAYRLRFWLLGLPAGIGYATLRAILKLWLGFSSDRSGVFSAGNGPAMRSAIIGVCYGDNLKKLSQLVKVSTRITHTDPKAEYGALAVAIAAHLSSQKSYISPQNYYYTLQNNLGQEASEFLQLIKKACDSATAQKSTENFANQLGLDKGVTGYIYHTVPVVIQTWLRYQQDYRTAIIEIIRCGGDTDTTAAILGGIIGASVGKEGIPSEWLDNLYEYPRTINWIESVGIRLAEVCNTNAIQKAIALPIHQILMRNLFFMILVIWHGFRRLFLP